MGKTLLCLRLELVSCVDSQFRRAAGRLHILPGQAGDKRDDNVAWRAPRLSPSVSSGMGWPHAGVRWCSVFQVVETAQSRERTERTLLTALSQLL